MKKVFLLIVIIMFSIFITGCEKQEYTLIEISGDELLDNINEGNPFIYAIYNERTTSKKGFLSDLRTVAEKTNQNIYYVNYQHLSSRAAIYIIDAIGYDTYYQTYGIFNGKEHEIVEDYTDYAKIFNTLKNHHYKDIKRYDEDKIEETLKEAQQLYSEYKYAAAKDKLNTIWSSQKAKNEFVSNKYYNLSNLWEGYEFIDNDKTSMIYNSLIIYSNNLYCSFYESKKEKFDGFQKPTLDKYTKKYYKIEKDIIYFSSKDDGSYYKKYQIVNISEEELILKDLTNKNRKEMKMQRRD